MTKNLLFTPPTEVPPAIVDAYWDWIEERVLSPVKEQFPDLYEWLVEYYRDQIQKLSETVVLKGGDS